MTWNVSFNDHVFNYSSYVHFLRNLAYAQQRGETRLAVDLNGPGIYYPDGMAPLVATVTDLRNCGYEVSVVLPESDKRQYFEYVGWVAALEGTAAPIHRRGTNYLPLTWYEESTRLNELVATTLELLSEATALPAGVIDAISWSLNEVADNVLIHAGASARGWLQLTLFPTKGEVEIVVVDRGRGIRSSLAEAYPELVSDSDALALAVQKGITRDKKLGQGNGLSGVIRIASCAKGWTNIHSGSAAIRVTQSGLESPAMPEHQGTLVTITLPTMDPIDLTAALWGMSGASVYFEERYLEDRGVMFSLKDEATGFGNRDTGRLLRVKLQNLMTQFPDDLVLIDFAGVDMITASFADEFVAKLVAEMGVTAYFARVRIRGANNFIAHSLDEVIGQRLNS